MIVVASKPGQLGNLLFVYANLLAYSIENNIPVFNPSFYEYQKYFKSTNSYSPVINKITYRIVFVLARLLDKFKLKIPFVYVRSLDWSEKFDLDIPNEFLNKRKVCLLQGWLYRGESLIKKHKEAIINFFTPSQKFTEAIDAFFKNNFNTETERIVAIHIRRGDYRNFEGGKYYYSIGDYSEIINKASVFFKNFKVHFLICSNEKIDLEELNKNNYKMTLGLNHELMDMYCMARCHYIIGPPSTYSMWASFYGNVPLCMLHDKNKELKLNEFIIQ